jgi:hypothetical protein
MYVAMAFFGAGRAFWMPTGQAITPKLVPPAVFPSAVAVNGALFQAAAIGGPGVGGLLYLLGPDVVYGATAALLLLAMALVLAIKPLAPTAKASWQFSDTLEGLRFVFRQRVVLGAISLDLFAVLFGGATYAALFTALALLTRRALVAGLVYVLFWEGALSGTFPAMRYLSVRQWTLSVASSLTASSEPLLQDRPSLTASLVGAALLVALSVYAGGRRLQQPRMQR